MKLENLLSRRAALRRLAGSAAAATLTMSGGAEAASQPKQTNLGLVIYTQGILRRARRAADRADDLFDPFVFLQHCHQLGAGGMQIPLGVMEPAECERLRETAGRLGLFIEGIVAPPFQEEDAERFEAEIQTAARAGACAVRTVIIPGRRYEYFKSREQFERYLRRGEQSLIRAKPIVERHAVPLAVENHKDQRLDQRVALLKRINSPWIGACVDTGNSFALLEDPLVVVEGLAPLALSVHLKDQAVQEYDKGFLLADVALGDGFLPLKEMVAVLRRAKPDVNFSLESITRDPLRVPCLAESYWPTFPDLPAVDLARTLRIVRSRAAAELAQIGSLPIEKQIQAERVTVVRSLDYARTRLEI